jgi:hypothetical protein
MKWMRLLSQNQGARGTSNAKPAALYWLLAQRYAENKKNHAVRGFMYLAPPAIGVERSSTKPQSHPTGLFSPSATPKIKKTTQCVVLCIWLRLLGSNQRPND